MGLKIKDLLFVGTYGHVKALHKRSGKGVWEVSLPRTGYEIVNLLIEDGVLYAASMGLLFALDPMTGRILWKNKLKGLGQGHLVLATAGASSGKMGMMGEDLESDVDLDFDFD